MIYGYIRVSTDKQTVENQRFEINEFLKEKEARVDIWIEETISATRKLEDRKLGELLYKLKMEDILIVSELSRLGRNLFQVMSILNFCMERNIKIYTVKENYELGNNINSKVLAFAFGLSAEIERQLISQRTKEALSRKKSEGIVLGRPKGKKTDFKKLKLYPYKNEIIALREEGASYKYIAKKYKVNRNTVSNFFKRIKEFEETPLDSNSQRNFKK